MLNGINNRPAIVAKQGGISAHKAPLIIAKQFLGELSTKLTEGSRNTNKHTESLNISEKNDNCERGPFRLA